MCNCAPEWERAHVCALYINQDNQQQQQHTKKTVYKPKTRQHTPQRADRIDAEARWKWASCLWDAIRTPHCNTHTHAHTWLKSLARDQLVVFDYLLCAIRCRALLAVRMCACVCVCVLPKWEQCKPCGFNQTARVLTRIQITFDLFSPAALSLISD